MDGEEYSANDSPANTVAETPAENSRNRKRRPETWKRNVAKEASLENKVNDERDKTVKHNLQIELLAHKKRADTFYQKLREKSKKDAYAKGANQIASSLHHRLNKLNLDEVTTIRLFSDDCGGQNKNQTVIGMLSHWILLEAPNHLKDIVLLFLIVCHLCIPPDRVFGNLEQYFRNESTIENPEKRSERGEMKYAKINYVRTLLTLHFEEKWEENIKLSFQQQTAADVPATARNDNDDDEEREDFELMYDEGTEIC
ncbi:hypothetical protein PR048_005238 [Dryococelus australis]|uniref:DUF7869 domain-containing protein n=1 Tax=Dryococelus australis TaxID=614101 RepID=A0ABQ9I850_9NEOP|nr:hypothetical protein PR048_005238 [Dryococelus australis]